MQKEKNRRGIAASLDMPMELEKGIPKITVIGGMSVLVENHGGICGFSPQCITLSCGSGKLVIRGEDMVLRLLKKDEIEAEGRISSVSFAEEGKV